MLNITKKHAWSCLLLVALLVPLNFSCRRGKGGGGGGIDNEGGGDSPTPAETTTSSYRQAKVTRVMPLKGKPGDVLTLTGENLDAETSLHVAVGDVRANVEVTDATRATFTMPDGLGLGIKMASVVGGSGEVGRFNLVADSADNTLPIMAADASQVCSEITYINAAGVQTSGTRDCAVNPYDLRKGVSFNGVAGKLNTLCQNTSNTASFNMTQYSDLVTGSTSLRVARVKKITPEGVLTLGAYQGLPMPPLNNDTYVRPLGNHPIKVGTIRVNGIVRFWTQVMRSADPPSDITDADSVAIMLEGTLGTVTFPGALCDETDPLSVISTDCFDVVMVDGSYRSPSTAEVWDTIDDLNYGGAPDAAVQDAFNAGICGYWEGDGSPDATWQDVTRTDAGAPSSCVATNANCTIKDLRTGISWFKGNGTQISWYKAVQYCSQLTIGGQGGWRLPTQKDLMNAYINAISRRVGNGTVADYNVPWWSSTTSSQQTDKAWVLNLATGSSVAELKGSPEQVIPRAMCVRGP